MLNSPTDCFLCGGPAGSDEYCYECEEYICQDCDLAGGVFGKHVPLDHRDGDGSDHAGFDNPEDDEDFW